MKIMILVWNCYCLEDFVQELGTMPFKGHAPKLFLEDFDQEDHLQNEEKKNKFVQALKDKKPDIVFSFNFFPEVSNQCMENHIHYISWVYDCPQVMLYLPELGNACNDVFLFDSGMTDIFLKKEIKNVHYLPMAAEPKRLIQMHPDDLKKKKYTADISFVGSMYTEKFNFYDQMEAKLDDYTKGFLDGLMRMQLQADGIHFIEKSLTQKVLDGMMNAMPVGSAGSETIPWIYTDYFIDRKMAFYERSEILQMLGERFDTALYTNDPEYQIKGVRNMGPVDYYEEMPYVFKCSKINLNLTLRSIEKGIPLRAIEIMGCGGFLLTNYQEDLLRYFVPNEDFVYYESREDLKEKVSFYLSHDADRIRIAENGYRKITKEHTFQKRIHQMFRRYI